VVALGVESSAIAVVDVVKFAPFLGTAGQPFEQPPVPGQKVILVKRQPVPELRYKFRVLYSRSLKS
jgi:hypothetical protein